MRPIIPHTLVLGLSESLIGLSMGPLVFSKLIPKVCQNWAPRPSGRAYLRTVTQSYAPGNDHDMLLWHLNYMFLRHLNKFSLETY